MHFSPAFYRVGGACSLLSALTTLLLIFLPRWFSPADDFTGRMARVEDPLYQLRAWVYLVHPFLVFTAALGVAMRLRRQVAALAIPGLLGFALWAATEAGQQALTLIAFDRWRRAYLAGDPIVRSRMELHTALYDGLWDAMFFLLLLGFLIGNVMYALAMWRGQGLARALSLLYLAAAMLALFGIAGELGVSVLPSALGFWLYPAIQPLARTLIGVWLWRHCNEDEPFDGGSPRLLFDPSSGPR
jgi:hypothetical protein